MFNVKRIAKAYRDGVLKDAERVRVMKCGHCGMHWLIAANELFDLVSLNMQACSQCGQQALVPVPSREPSPALCETDPLPSDRPSADLEEVAQAKYLGLTVEQYRRMVKQLRDEE